MKAASAIARRRLWCVLGASGAALVLGVACGSDDGAKTVPRVSDAAGAGGDAGGSEPMNVAGDSATNVAGGGAGNDAVGGQSALGGAGAASAVGGAGAAGAGGASGEAGLAGAGGASCEAVDPTALRGTWTTTCNGYTCKMNVAESGDLATGCTNGQYSTGTLDGEGGITTLGEGGPYAAFSTAGQFTALGCDSLAYDYKGRIPPLTGPEQAYSCTLTRQVLCKPTLLETMAGTWQTTCGSSTCTTTFGLDGSMSSTCSNGQKSTGSIDETGAFADAGGGGNFADYSTVGVVAPTGCDTFLMPYTYQSPPNQGTKHSAQCSYTRKVE
jgi:collagen type I alpha